MGCHAKKIRQFTDYQFAFTPVENIDKSKGGVLKIEFGFEVRNQPNDTSDPNNRPNQNKK